MFICKICLTIACIVGAIEGAGLAIKWIKYGFRRLDPENLKENKKSDIDDIDIEGLLK